MTNRAMRRGEHPQGLNKLAPESHKAGKDAPATPTYSPSGDQGGSK